MNISNINASGANSATSVIDSFMPNNAAHQLPQLTSNASPFDQSGVSLQLKGPVGPTGLVGPTGPVGPTGSVPPTRSAALFESVQDLLSVQDYLKSRGGFPI
jgi:hypothetical protein